MPDAPHTEKMRPQDAASALIAETLAPDGSIPRASGHGVTLGLVGLAVAFAVILLAGSLTRLSARATLHRARLAASVPTVAVTHPGRLAPARLALPARLDAWYQAPVYARTNGYLRRWFVDIGSNVHKGQVLATIETPDLDQELHGAVAALATAQANLDLARTTSARWQKLLAQNAVSRQSADDRAGNYAAKLAMRNQAAAEVKRLQALTGFQNLVAPFDGVVTSRATDIGNLIIAQSASSAPLFTVADESRLRVYVSVPQAYVAAIRTGMTAHFDVPDRPGERFTATVVRTARAIDPGSDSMLVQLEYDNTTGMLRPGAYATLNFDLADNAGPGLVQIPADALLFRSGGTSVAVVDETDRVHMVPVHIITDLGTTLTVTGRLSADDRVIDSPNDAVTDGDAVRPIPDAANRLTP